jgi:hypothetical protein
MPFFLRRLLHFLSSTKKNYAVLSSIIHRDIEHICNGNENENSLAKLELARQCIN